MANHHFYVELEGELLWETSADENCSEKNVVYVKGLILCINKESNNIE